jgi:hypothetical protein
MVDMTSGILPLRPDWPLSPERVRALRRFRDDLRNKQFAYQETGFLGDGLAVVIDALLAGADLDEARQREQASAER